MIFLQFYSASVQGRRQKISPLPMPMLLYNFDYNLTGLILFSKRATMIDSLLMMYIYYLTTVYKTGANLNFVFDFNF